MYGREQRVLLRHYLQRRGPSKAEIARELGVSRRTVYHWIASGQLDRELGDAQMRYAARPPVTRKVAPFAASSQPVLPSFRSCRRRDCSRRFGLRAT